MDFPFFAPHIILARNLYNKCKKMQLDDNIDHGVLINFCKECIAQINYSYFYKWKIIMIMINAGQNAYDFFIEQFDEQYSIACEICDVKEKEYNLSQIYDFCQAALRILHPESEEYRNFFKKYMYVCDLSHNIILD